MFPGFAAEHLVNTSYWCASYEQRVKVVHGPTCMDPKRHMGRSVSAVVWGHMERPHTLDMNTVVLGRQKIDPSMEDAWVGDDIWMVDDRWLIRGG